MLLRGLNYELDMGLKLNRWTTQQGPSSSARNTELQTRKGLRTCLRVKPHPTSDQAQR